MPRDRGGVTCHEIDAPFGEWQLLTAILQSLNIVSQKYLVRKKKLL